MLGHRGGHGILSRKEVLPCVVVQAEQSHSTALFFREEMAGLHPQGEQERVRVRDHLIFQ